MNPKAGGEEEDCVDSGAETGGSDYSHLSSTSSELSVEEAQDPFLVSIHIIADPGASQPLQEAIDKVLAWVHPDLPLFRVSERRTGRRRRKSPKGAQPALAVVLFLQEEYGEEQILQVHQVLQQPPWRHHHTERVHGRFLPYLPCSQDFFTLAPGTPLWAIRPVHYGKEIVRFTIYCRHNSYADSLRFYELILRRSPSQRKADFCIFSIFSNLDVDIQFSLKRLPCDQTPVPTDSSVLEFRVKDIGQLVPLLPNPCSPISEGRWQTEDHDGNKILLQAQRTHKKVPKYSRAHHSSEKKPHSTPSTAIDTPSTAQGSSRIAPQNSPFLGSSQVALLSRNKRECTPQSSTSSPAWSFQRSKSLFCLPSGGPSPTEPQPLLTGSQRHSASEWRPSNLLSIDDLEGAQETDVDTGLRLSSSDLSVVSAYSAPSRFCNSVESSSLPSKRCSSHWPAPKSPEEGPLPAASEVSPDTSWDSHPVFTKGSPSPAEITAAALSASGVSSPTELSPQLSCQDSKTTQGGQDMLLPPTTAGLEDNDMEEFYI
ncbi:protein FAM124A isoform X2 [Cricetulus griseus]|uniref:Family with sequence similarity 124, member A n=1 Tax=Cricetulus griseus TaxID=10029 RepID=A0A8C2M3E5_CRIGR|nr:protein FAM124A isoform X2 [Cricetulus griseus]